MFVPPLCYLAVPWVLDLPWSILYHLVCIEVVLRLVEQPAWDGGLPSQVLAIVLIYVLGFWPALVTTAMAKARDPATTWRHAVKLGHAFIITNYLS